MSTQSVLVQATPDRVWEVLADGWLYPLFVVGAARMRSVDDGWPAPGTRLHHSVGSWPVMLDDTTEVLECSPPGRLHLRANGRPGGVAEIVFRVTADGAASRVDLEEDVVAGPALLVPRWVRHLPIRWRNAETLQRLALLVEGRSGGPVQDR